MNPRLLKSWSQRSAVVYTTATGNIGMMIRELLRNHGWKVALSTDNVDDVITCVRAGQADLIIIDDEINYSSTTVVRKVMTDPICCLLPVLAFLSDQNRNERLALSRLGRPEIVAKPLTPDKFIPGFERLILRWSGGIYLPVRKSSEFFIQGKESLGIDMLEKLAKYEASHAMVLPALAKYLAKTDSPKAAEKLLINGLQAQSRDLSIVFALVDLYLHHAMPSLAMRLLKTVYKSYLRPECITSGIIQASFLTNNLGEAINFLKEQRQKNPEDRVLIRYLCRSLFSEGRIEEFKRIASRSHNIIRYEEEWSGRRQSENELDEAG